jgi:hypothetical protein
MKKTALSLAAVLGSLLASTSAWAQDPPPPADPQPAPPPATQPAQPTPPTTEPNTPPTPAQSGPTVTLQTGNPPTDSTQDPTKTAEENKPPRAFAGSVLSGQVSMFTGTVFKGQQQYYDPTVEGNIYILPRYSFHKDWQIRGRLIYSYEFTNSDSTTTQHEPRFSDTTLQLFYRGIPEIPKAKIKLLAGIQSAFPTSPESRARTLYFSPGVAVSAARVFDKVLGGEISLAATATYTHPFYRSKTPEVRNDFPYSRQSCSAASCEASSTISPTQGQQQDALENKGAAQLSGSANVSDSIAWLISASGEWGKWSPGAYGLVAHQWAYTFQDIPGVTRLDDRTHVRNTVFFLAFLDYNFNHWIGAEVGYFMQRNILREDGTYGNPFFDRYQDTRVYLGANFNPDSFVEEVIQKKKEKDTPPPPKAAQRKPMMGF